MPGEMPFFFCNKISWKRTCFVKFCQVCLVKCRFAKRNWKRTCLVIFVKYAWWNAVVQKQTEREHVLSSLPGEICKENMFCQVCLVKCRFAKGNWKRTCFVIFVKYAWWNAVVQKQTEREHVLSYAWGNAVFQKQVQRKHVLSSLSHMPGEVPFCKNKLKRTCFVKYAWWNAVFLAKKTSWKRTCFVKFCQVCLVKCRFAKRNWKRTCLVIFVKYAWWNAVVQKQTEREHALSKLPGEICKENMLCQVCLGKCRFPKTR